MDKLGFSQIKIIGLVVFAVLILGGAVFGMLDFFNKKNKEICNGTSCNEKEKKAGKEKQVEGKTAELSLDYSQPSEEFSPYIFGTLASPFFDKNGYKLTKEAGFKMIEINMGVEMPTDVNDPSQYDFISLDKAVSEAVANSLEPLVWFNIGKKPDDLDKFAVFSANIAKHLTQGWANGYQWEVKAFRFGNEPDTKAFWTGTRNDFFETYAAWASAMKGVDGNFVLVAPGLVSAKLEQGINSWFNEFLEYCKKNNVPVDMVSIHAYSPVVRTSFYDDFNEIGKELKKYNISPLYGTPKLANDEWNLMVGDPWSGSYHKQFDNAWMAAHNISALISMVENGLALSVRYGGAFNNGKECHDFPLTDCKGLGKPVYYAFKGFNMLSGKKQLSVKGDDNMNMAAIAGKSENEIIIVVSNFDIKAYRDKYESKIKTSKFLYDHYVSKYGEPAIYDKFNIEINNLPWDGQQIGYERYVVDDENKLGLKESQTISGDEKILLSENISAPSVQVIRLYKK